MHVGELILLNLGSLACLQKIIRHLVALTAGLQGPIVRASRGPRAWAEDPVPLSRSAWNRAIKVAIKIVRPGLGLDRLSSHSFRKGGFTAAREAGMPIDCAIDVIGHICTDTWQAYCFRKLDDTRAWVARI